MRKRKVKCYIYIRVSTLTQADNFSLDAQREKLHKYAEYQDMIIAGEYADEGFSGKNIQGRQGFKQMLDDIQSGKDDVEYVLVFKLSRFGRNAADVLYSLQLMQDFGVNLICVEDGIDSSKDAGKLMISVLSAVAEIERENIRVQTMAGREQKAREGKWNGVKAIKEKIGTAIDTEDMEKELETLRSQLRQIIGTKNRLEKQMDTLDVSDKHCDRKVLDLQRRYDEQYDRIEEIKLRIDELKNQIQSIHQEIIFINFC